MAAGDAPVRLSAGLSRSSASFGGETSNATSVNVGATLLFGGSRNANREPVRLVPRSVLRPSPPVFGGKPGRAQAQSGFRFLEGM